MRADSLAFAAKNIELAKRPRYVVELAFDPENTVLWYFTSHADAALPGGASSIAGVVKGISGTSQTLQPDVANASIGNISFSVVDKASVVTDTLGTQLVLGRSTRRQRVRVYVGFEDMAWADYTLVQTQLVSEISYKDGAYEFTCADIQREMRKDIFELGKTTLATALSDSATAIDVVSTTDFSLVAHGTSYSDAPSATVGYVKVQDEVIRYTSKTATQFTGCTRGALNTRAVEHAVDLTAAADRRTAVEEYVYLEMPAVKLMYALLTGILHNQGGATLPTAWHLGIPTSYVRLSDFSGIGADLWDTSDDVQGFNVRLEGMEKSDGKKFIETELALLTGVFMPVYADGALGLRRMAGVLAGSSYVAHLDESNVVSAGNLVHDFDALRNVLQVSWNWEPAREEFTRINLLIDASSVTIHGKADPLKLKFRGLHGSRHSSIMLAQRFDSLRDRYTGPPLRIEVQALQSLNTLEVGDVVRLRLQGTRDFVANAPLDRSFEIQNIATDWVTGNLNLRLFGSSQAPGVIAPSADATVLSQAWYVSQGTALSSVVTITGSAPGHVTVGGTLTGNVDMNAAGAIYYYDGDLVIDAGVTLTIENNVQLRVKGFLTNNGTIDGIGGGHPGAVAVVPSDRWTVPSGVSGFLASTQAGGGIVTGFTYQILGVSLLIFPVQGNLGSQVVGLYQMMPSFNITWNGSVLSGVPSDLRGSSGSVGNTSTYAGVSLSAGDPHGAPSIYYSGGEGGGGGAGLVIVSRGFAQGVSAKIDTSGAPGLQGVRGTPNPPNDRSFRGGSGAGGAPGGLLLLLDGASASATGLTETGFVALQGKTPIASALIANGAIVEPGFDVSFSSVGTGDGSTFPLPSLSGARGGSRVQYIPSSGTVEADAPVATLSAPTNLGLASGTAELLVSSDGTVVPRIKATWTPSVDARVVGYEIQFKPSSGSIWSNAPLVLGQLSDAAWIIGVQDGINYDVRLRSAGAVREVGDWVTITDYPVIGKTEKPSNVGTLSFADPFLSWVAITDVDRRGYIVRYQVGVNNDWASASPAHVAGFITETRFDTSSIVGGSTTMLVKSVDTSGNESAAASTLLVDLRPAVPTSFEISRQPDGTREFSWALDSPPTDLAGYHLRYFLGTTSDWAAMTPLHTGLLVSSPHETNSLAAGTYTFAIKAVDLSGNESATALFITTVTIGDPRIPGVIEDFKEETGWAGTKTSCVVDAMTGWLIATDSTTWAGLPATWDAWTSWTMAPASPITYMREIDIGVKVKFIPLVTALSDGTQVIEEQHSDDGAAWSSYAVIGPLVDARYIRILVTVTGSFPKLKTERIVLSASPIEEIVEDQDSSVLTGSYRIGTGDVRVPITKVYTTIKKVDITLQSVGAGWSWELIDKDTSVGPRIKIYNASNAAADAVFDATVIGI